MLGAVVMISHFVPYLSVREVPRSSRSSQSKSSPQGRPSRNADVEFVPELRRSGFTLLCNHAPRRWRHNRTWGTYA